VRLGGVAEREATPGPERADPAGAGSRLSRFLRLAILAVVGLLLIEVLFEGWLVTIFGHLVGFDLKDRAIIDQAGWPKTLKSSLYALLFVLTVAKFTADRAWHELTTKADIALAVTGVAMVIAGYAGGSSTLLIGQGLFVYFRGVIVFYAIRALRPRWEQVKPFVWIVGGIITVDALIGFVQFIIGKPAYSGLGWLELQWARENRAQGLLDHPNNLGHVTGFMLLGLLAWFLTLEKVSKRWWALFTLVAIGLSVAQSRQSIVATIAGFAAIALLRRDRLKRIIVAALVVVALGALPVIFSPKNRAELAYRLGGVFNALHMQSGKECEGDPACRDTDGEIRVFFVRQGLELWQASPVLGYGVGQFGGIVAVQNDPLWNLDPRFQEVLGPKGFDLLRFKSTSVDVFWLHLLVEVGALGFLAYLVWMWFVTTPLIRPARQRGDPVLVWSVAALVFALLIAAWSPALEDPLFPPLLFAVVGFGWVLWQRTTPRVEGRI
jgi:hypothetical protein